MHLPTNRAEIVVFVLVELHDQPNLNHSVAIFGLVVIAFEMVLEMILRGIPRLSLSLTFHKHEFVLIQPFIRSLKNLEEAKVGLGVGRHCLLNDRKPLS